MDWMKEIGGLLGQYSGMNAKDAPPETEQHFSQVAGSAPKAQLSEGLSEAFRSPQTPPFPEMLANLFRNSDGQQRANVLNTLIGSVGPGMLGGLLSQYGMKQGQVTPEQAQQVPPEAVSQIAKRAEEQDPSIIDRVSDFYAEQPGIIKALGVGALALVLGKMANRL
jgi:hypothetical protein